MIEFAAGMMCAPLVVIIAIIIYGLIRMEGYTYTMTIPKFHISICRQIDKTEKLIQAIVSKRDAIGMNSYWIAMRPPFMRGITLMIDVDCNNDEDL